MELHGFAIAALLPLTATAFASGANPPVAPRLTRLPLTFEQNTGRYDRKVKFVSRLGGGSTLFLTNREAVIVTRTGGAVLHSRRTRGLPEPPSQSRVRMSAVRMKLEGSQGAAAVVGVEKQPGVVNYLIGNDRSKWRRNVPTFGQVRMAGVYPGVDLVYYQQSDPATGRRALEYDFVVKPGADASRIRLAFTGADRMRVADGDLVLTTAAGDLRLKRPYAYQQLGGRRVQVACGYRTAPGSNRVGFQVARYDTTRPLVVDPVLEYATYLGGIAQEWATGVAVDGSGCAYVSGIAGSTSWNGDPADFPTTTGAFDTTAHRYADAFVSKLNASGTALVYSTFIAGDGSDYANAVALDPAGCAHVTGFTDSSDFPTTPGAFRRRPSSGNVFVSKLSPSGDTLAYSTLVGAEGAVGLGIGAEAYGIAVDAAGAAYITGYAWPRFPTTVGAFQETCPSDPYACFVTKLNPSGSGLAYSTYLGGTQSSRGYGIAVGPGGSAYITGWTAAIDFPTTPGAFQPSTETAGVCFVTKVSASGSALDYSTFLTGPNASSGQGIAVDSAGAAFVTGGCGPEFPWTPGAYRADTPHGFVSKLDASGAALSYSALAPIGTLAISVTAGGSAYVCGEPIHVLRLDATGSTLVQSVTIDGVQRAIAIAVDLTGAAYVVGSAQGLQTTTGAFAETYAGGPSDGFVAKLGRSGSALILPEVSGAVGATVSLAATLTDAGGTALAGKVVSIGVGGVPLGSPITSAQGIALQPYKIPEGVGEGQRTINAAFAGDPDWSATSATGTLMVTRSATSLYVPDRSGLVTSTAVLKGYLKRLTDNAWVVGRPVTFSIAGTGVGSASTDSDGMAPLPWVIDGVAGTRAIRADFAGDAAYNACSGTGTLTATTLATRSYVPGHTGRVRAVIAVRAYLYLVSGAPLANKPVLVKVDGAVLGTTDTNPFGRVLLTYAVPDAAGAGTRTISADFGGHGAHAPSSATGMLTVPKGDLYIWPYARSGKRGTVHGLQGYVRSLPDYVPQSGKTVTLRVNGTEIGSASSGVDGWATVNWSIPLAETIGGHTATAEFAGDAWYEPVSVDTVFNVVP